jgi:peptidoglycan/LPS O-acetylase OafA/YrhL
VFLYGYLIARDAGFWIEAVRLRRTSQVVALALFVPYIALVAVLPDELPFWQQAMVWVLRVFYIWSMLLAILGWGHALLNRPFRWLPWANESVYPWYVLHQSLIVGLGYGLAKLHFGPVTEPLLLLSGTIFGCWSISELVKRIGWLRPCFGLKTKPGPGDGALLAKVPSPRANRAASPPAGV